MRKGYRRTIYVFVICSLALHFFTGLGLYLAPRPVQFRSERIEVEFLSPADPAKRREEDRKQIVEQDQPINDEIDEKAKFLSAKDQKVLKQTRAENQGKFKNAQKSGAQVPVPPQRTPTPTPPEPNKQSLKRGLPSLASLKPQFVPQPVRPQLNNASGASGEASASDDYLKDVDKGMQTMLSTREFVFYSYYARIKERLRQNWEPTIREKVKMVFRQGRQIASTQDHITQVVVTLDRNGELIEVNVISPSGVEALDDAAVEAFQKSQPFPNPPGGMVEKDGRIRIHWDFVLEANNGNFFQDVDRYAQGEDDASDSSGGL
jgi:TonB family protein